MALASLVSWKTEAQSQVGQMGDGEFERQIQGEAGRRWQMERNSGHGF